jgi:hypothetical protein
MDSPLRCPACGALVVDRRFAQCTSCSVPLPADWVLTPEQIEKLEAIDRSARAEHGALMQELTRETETELPLLTRDDDPTTLD